MLGAKLRREAKRKRAPELWNDGWMTFVSVTSTGIPRAFHAFLDGLLVKHPLALLSPLLRSPLRDRHMSIPPFPSTSISINQHRRREDGRSRKFTPTCNFNPHPIPSVPSAPCVPSLTQISFSASFIAAVANLLQYLSSASSVRTEYGELHPP